MKLLDYINNSKTYIIAEMSGNHGGSIQHALEIVRAAAYAGADCLKIQTYTADTITINCRSEHFLLKTGLWENNYLYDLYSKAYTPWEWTQAIKDEAEKLGLDFLSTPFDFTAVDFLEKIGAEFYKIASFEAVDIPLIEKAAGTGKPVIISCGMASEEEIHEALEAAHSTGNNNIILLKCCSAYPTDYSAMNLRTIADMREKFGVPVGLSDHSSGSLADIAAVALGAAVIEKHICISREDKTVDSEFSLDKEEFKQMVLDVRNTELSLGRVSYGYSPDEEQSYLTRRSLFAVKDIEAGDVITTENVRSIRPAAGIKPKYLKQMLGKKAKSALHYGEPVTKEFLDELI